MGRRLGQHFLTNEAIAARIADSIDADERPLLEIGGGRGRLTKHLTGRSERLVVVELDPFLATGLRQQLHGSGEVIEADITDVDLAQLDPERRWAVIGNVPYYHTSAILLWLCEQWRRVDHAVVMIQAEVAERLVGQPGTKAYGRLTVAVRYRAEAEILFGVPPTAFRPPPKVNSAVVRLDFRTEPAVDVSDEERFFRVVEAGFRWRRKTLLNVLARVMPTGREGAAAALAAAGIEPRRRAETLSLEEFAALTETVADR